MPRSHRLVSAVAWRATGRKSAGVQISSSAFFKNGDKMIISVSGTVGSGKTTVSKEIAKRLHYDYYSMGDLRRKMALERGMDIHDLNKLGEKEAFTDREVDDYQSELGKKKDNFVIDARLAYHFIPHSEKVFLMADIRTRAKRIWDEERKVEERAESYSNLDEVVQKIKEREKSDTRRYKKYYGIRWDDKKLFDIIIDTTRLSIEEVVNEVMKELKNRGKGSQNEI